MLGLPFFGFLGTSLRDRACASARYRRGFMLLGTAMLLPMLNPMPLVEETVTLDHPTNGVSVTGDTFECLDHEFNDMDGEQGRSHQPLSWICGDDAAVMGRRENESSDEYVTLADARLSLRRRKPAGTSLGSAASSRLP